jgi:hypothetical protein
LKVGNFEYVQEFHVFHTSCLIDWMLWCEYVQRIKTLNYTDIEKVEIKKVEDIYEIMQNVKHVIMSLRFVPILIIVYAYGIMGTYKTIFHSNKVYHGLVFPFIVDGLGEI